MKSYYRERAPVYERVYAYPERRGDLAYLQRVLPDLFAGRDVLEIAAGTGYWTQYICKQANSILATDVTPEALAELHKQLSNPLVTTRVLDAYSLDDLERTYTAAFAGLWLSHVPMERRAEWLSALHRRLQPGAVVVFLDNSRAQCERLPLAHTDERGNTYQDRVTDSGETYRVLKNFPGEDELLAATAHLGIQHRFEELEHFWWFQYLAA